MAPTNKARAAGVSASSFLDLKAELAKKEEQFAKDKAAGKSTSVAGGTKRPDKKPTIWAKPNKGVKNRAARDIELEEISKPTLDAARAVLERKAQVYEKLRKGKSGGLNDKQYDSLLVDFDSKPIDAYESDSDDVDESLTVPKPSNEEDDPIIEYEDEFGRARTGRRSEVPRHLLPQEEAEPEELDPFVICASLAEENNPLNIHYDASKEVRAKGAGFYQFSGDAETRRSQMEELKNARDETGKTRQELGAVDLRPGEMEGMATDAVPQKSRALEKRKRELEERRRLLEAKRRKKDPGSGTPEPIDEIPVFSMPPDPPQGQPEHPPDHSPHNTSQEPADPFAVLEVKASSRSGKGKQTTRPINDADAFLASLEQDMLGKRSR
ncbi:hypothetical protein PHLGIDRAFT_74899 [Phlebiopsis gigantea 11061_1 CR5-6]|uniref:Uncharacterized protein n=1 Tax=Phlebiopsis gigantea (strain 11061_1 CR5-6) TaxID=745531 RepID=A0A0C3NJD0_PHLG1|nr:hypothetical protein PHLGIDRAFT_74899 [Phlebiopsis gigantea 11061_1 CR5-6]